MAESLSYRVPEVSCDHCRAAIEKEVAEVVGVRQVEIDLERKTVNVLGEALPDAALRAAIQEAGYEVA